MREAVLELKTRGNSLGMRIPSAVVRAARLQANQSVKLSVEDGRLIITRQTPKPPPLPIAWNNMMLFSMAEKSWRRR